MDSFGIYSVQQLRRQGWTRDRLAAARAAGEWFHVRRGFYAVPGAPKDLVRAVRLGGRATAHSALPFHGIWKPENGLLHVQVPRNGGRLRDPEVRALPLGDRSDVHVHWQDRAPVKENLLSFRPLVDAATAVRHAVQCGDDEGAVSVLDSAMNLRLIRLDEARLLLPADRRGLFPLLDPKAESGIESVARIRLQRAGYRVESQVLVRGAGHIDLVVEGRLALELDGRESHLTAEAFEEDRRRDMELSRQHLLHLRLTYRHVFHQWPACMRAIATALD